VTLLVNLRALEDVGINVRVHVMVLAVLELTENVMHALVLVTMDAEVVQEDVPKGAQGAQTYVPDAEVVL